MRLKSAFRVALYGTFALLFVSGVVWLLADKMKYDAEADTEMWQQASSFLLTLHGGAAMVTLMLLGALGPMHVQRARTNRTTGIASITLYGLLIATAFGLYYLGSEAVRPWISYLHIAFGLAVPAVIVAHVMVGRASTATKKAQMPRATAAAPTAATLVPADEPAEAILGIS
jgi:Na+-translocating ferredoxin:NAD+ oxidoreductase RnfE subunit